MGHWSTYRRRGGGPPSATHLNFIEVAEVQTPTRLHVTYFADINSTDFDLTDFTTNPNSRQPTDITQFDIDTLELEYAVDIEFEDSITYTGDAPNIETPQTVDLS